MWPVICMHSRNLFSARDHNGRLVTASLVAAGRTICLHRVRFALALCVCALAFNLARGTDGTWTNVNGGSWGNPANWSAGSVAGGSGSTEWFNTLTLTANATITLDGGRTVGNLNFDDKAATKHNWALNTGSAGPLTLDVTSGSPVVSNNVTTTIGAVVAGTRGLTKSGSGLLALISANTYSGTTVVNAGILDAQNAQALGSSSVTINNVNGAILQLDGGLVVSGSALLNLNTQTGANGLQAGSGSNVWAGPITLGDTGVRFGAAVATVLNLAGPIDSGGKPNDFRVRGQQANPPGVVLLSGTNSYGGNTLVNVGVLQLGNASALPGTTTVELGIGAGGSCTFDLAGYSPVISGLANLPSQTYYGWVTNSSPTAATLTVSNNLPNTYSGNIAGNLALTKLGSNTLTLGGTNTYTGPTLVGAGTLTGTGSIAGAVTVQTGAALAPGTTSIGTLSIGNSLTLNPGSATVIKVDRNNPQPSDQVNGVTTLTAGGTLQVNNIGSAALAAGDSFKVLSAAVYGGQFSAITPAHPNGDTSLDWDTNQLATAGRLAVFSNGTTSSVVTIAFTNATGLTVRCDSTGIYTINSQSPAWTFGGSLGTQPSSLALNSGSDNIGPYSEVTFFYTNGVGQLAGIRAYSNQPVVLFSQTCLAASANNLAFPRLTTYPTNLYHIGFASTFGIYSFSMLSGDSPWLFFDTNFNSFLVSPAANFMLANNVAAANNGPLTCGLSSAITSLPAHFTHRTLLVVQSGINRTFETWGNALTGLSGKIRPANDAAVELNKLGYWTDNGAVYYYNYDATRGYAGTLLAVRDEFASKGVALGYMQLDSWWYPKSYLATWQGGPTNNRGGIFLYQADAQLFPAGLAAFHQQLGLPLLTHARWIDDYSPYRTNYALSKNAPVDPAYWSNILAAIAAGGVVTYEQDWMDNNCLPLINLNDPPAFMNGMAAAAASNGLHLQYCMPLPRHYLQGSLYNNLLTMRVCNDHFTAGNWNPFLYDSRLVSAAGAWPWCDVFMSSEPRSVLLATLSGGPVGPGDALGAVNAANLVKSVRADSVIVKPDVPLLPLDSTYLGDAQGNNQPMVAAASTDHNGLKAFYVFSYARQSANATASFASSALGLSGDAYVYDYFNHTGAIISNGAAFSFTTTLADVNVGGSYFIVVPIGPSGLALVGDTNKFVTLSRKRVSDLSDTGIIAATLQFAAGETNLLLSGYSPSMPFVSASVGAVNAVTYDALNHWFSAGISPGAGQNATLTLSLRPLLQASVLPGSLQLSWPAVPVTALERATTLSLPADWTPVTNGISTIAGRNSVTVDTTSGAAFFRLRE
jgi:autotransporter-associated beta strand protein